MWVTHPLFRSSDNSSLLISKAVLFVVCSYFIFYGNRFICLSSVLS